MKDYQRRTVAAVPAQPDEAARDALSVNPLAPHRAAADRLLAAPAPRW